MFTIHKQIQNFWHYREFKPTAIASHNRDNTLTISIEIASNRKRKQKTENCESHHLAKTKTQLRREKTRPNSYSVSGHKVQKDYIGLYSFILSSLIIKVIQHTQGTRAVFMKL